jgi:hypothetical protein
MKTVLIFLIAIMMVLSLTVAIILMSFPDGNLMGLNVKLLSNTPFKDFQFVGLILFAIVGFPNTIAWIFLTKNYPKQYNFSIYSALLLISSIVLLFIYANYFVFIQSILIVVAILIVLISNQLKGKNLI